VAGQGVECVTGRIPVLECLRAKRRRAHRLHLLKSGKGLETVLGAVGKVPVRHATREELDRLAGGGTHQGVVLEADPLPVLSVEGWLKRLPSGGAPFVVLLDEVQDPHNLGAVVRSAAACGAAGVLFAKDRSAPLSPAAVKAAAGAMEYVDLVQATNLARALGVLKKAGFWVAGLEAEGAKVLWDADLGGRMALVVGSEGKGIRRLVREQCDLLVRIPLTGPITSLNASVSAGIALAECVRQRRGTPGPTD